MQALCHYWILPFLSAVKWDRLKSHTLYVFSRSTLRSVVAICPTITRIVHTHNQLESLMIGNLLAVSRLKFKFWSVTPCPLAVEVHLVCHLSSHSVHTMNGHLGYVSSYASTASRSSAILNDIDQAGTQKVSDDTKDRWFWYPPFSRGKDIVSYVSNRMSDAKKL